ncbi:MAG: alcohol dehydrogenase catalytic domain-containing protein [Bacillota bacterium]|nr:alcohol dehydrogenase catalytic domain-containing protein [Bacillota bacterium]
MKAAILKDQKNLIITDVPKPKPKFGEVLVAVSYAGICRTDRKSYLMGQRDLDLPRVLGHEASGVIAAVGDGVSNYKAGEKVQVHPGIGCGKCEACLQGNDHLCSEIEIIGFHLDGAFSEYLLVPQRGVEQGIIQKVPDSLGLKTAVFCEPLACAVNMEIRLGFYEQKVLIIGGGVLGLLMGKLAQIKGCDDVIILEKEPQKIKVGKEMGIKSFPHTMETAEIKRIWPGGADVAVPCCPQNQGFRRSLKLLKPRGKLGFFSGLTSDDAISRDEINLLHYKELSLYGSYGCSLKNAKESLKLIDKYQQEFHLPSKYIALTGLEDILSRWEIVDDIGCAVEF